MSTSGSPASERLVTRLGDLPAHVGVPLGPTRWRSFTQQDIDRFADLTDDHNFIHVDPERAARTPFGSTIAHGYFTLSMLAPISMELLSVTDIGMGVNYGFEKVRFPAPVRVGARFRGRGELREATEIRGGMQVRVAVTIEVENLDKPAVVAECVFRFYT